MKILMLNNEFPPLGGGTGTVNYELFKQFANYPEIEIDLLTSDRGRQKQIEQFSQRIKIIKYPVNNKNIHHSSNKELIIYTLKAFWGARKLIQKRKYDFCFVWSTLPAGVIALWFNIFRKLPYIIRISGPDIPGFEERFKNIYRFFTPLIKYTWKKSYQVIAKCQQEVTLIQNIQGNIQPKIIHNGIDMDKFGQEAPESNNQQGSFIVLCVARLIKHKGQYDLIHAIVNYPGIHLVLVGDGDEKKNYQDLVSRLGISKRVYFKGYVSRENIKKYYEKAHIFVLPSYNEGMSNALLEAMAAGLPVIVTDTGGTKELVIENKNGWIYKAGDIERLKNILKKAMVCQDKLPGMGRISKKIAEKHNWEKIARQYVTFFKKVT